MIYQARQSEIEAEPVKVGEFDLVVALIGGEPRTFQREEFEYFYEPQHASAAPRLITHKVPLAPLPAILDDVLREAKEDQARRRETSAAPPAVLESTREQHVNGEYPRSIRHAGAKRQRLVYDCLREGPRDLNAIADWCEAAGWVGVSENTRAVSNALFDLSTKKLVEKVTVGGEWRLVTR